jgi:phage baseplate assembly protein W
MAFNAKKIFPIDRKPGTAVGIDLPLNSPSVFRSNYTTKDSIKSNLVNYFLTNTTERYLNPTFGGNIRSFIFEQINSSNTDSLKEDIQSKISLNFPNINIKDLEVYSFEDNNTVSIEMTYEILNTGVEDEIQIAFN